MSSDPKDAAERRDAVLRRMLAMPKASKAEQKGGEPKPAAPSPTSSAKSALKRAPKP